MRLFFKAPVPLRTASLRTYVARRARFALGRFGDRVQSVTVSFEDVEGPGGCIDKRCTITLRIPGEPEIAVRAGHEESFAAADLAMSKARRALVHRRDAHPSARVFRLRGVTPGLETAARTTSARGEEEAG